MIVKLDKNLADTSALFLKSTKTNLYRMMLSGTFVLLQELNNTVQMQLILHYMFDLNQQQQDTD